MATSHNLMSNMSSFSRRLSILLLLGTLTGCATSPERSGNGVSFAGAPEVTLEEVARLTEPVFGRISAVYTMPNGSIIVGDQTSNSFTVLDETGRLQYTFGREGQGPGEFSYLPSLVVAHDTLYTIQFWPDRLGAWVPGQTAPARSADLQMPFQTSGALTVHDGRFILIRYPSYGRVERSEPQSVVIGHWDQRTGAARDSVLILPAPDSAVVRTERSVSMWSPPFGRQLLFASDSRGRLIHVWTGAPEVHIHDAELQFERSIVLAHPSLPFLREDLDGFFAEYPEMDPAMRRALTDIAPDTWPPVQHLMVDAEDRIWLALRTEADAPLHWVILSPGGDVIGQATVPRNIRLYAAHAGTVWGVDPENVEAGGPVLLKFRMSGL
jgi:hypothetical protein